MDLIEFDFGFNNRHPWETARIDIIKNLIMKYNNHASKVILDIGSGDAYLANELTLFFLNTSAYGVDIGYNEQIITKLTKQYSNQNLHLYSSLTNVSQNNETVDIVTFLDVIEHVENDLSLIKEVVKSSLVKSDTVFIFTVPAYQGLFSQHDELLKHYRRYKLKQLKSTILNSGLKVIEGGYFFTSLIPVRLLQLLQQKVKKRELSELTNLGKWDKNKLITKFIHLFLYSDYIINRLLKKAGIQLPGLSCYVIAVKK